MSEDDPLVDGQAWAQRQEDAFGEWIARYGGGDPAVWDRGLNSLDVLSYILLHYSLDAAFFDGAAWYLGELVRRSDLKKFRWTKRTYGFNEGEYVVEHTATTRSDESVAPRSHLQIAVDGGDPQFLRAWYADYASPLWDKPWPAWVHDTEAGQWTWDADTVRWMSQCDMWCEGVSGLLDVLGDALPEVVLDYSTDSLRQVELVLLGGAMSGNPLLRNAMCAYLGECLLRAAGGKWIWDDRPDSVTNGFPVVTRSAVKTSPAHVLDYALAWRDGNTLARLHRAALRHADSERLRGVQFMREPTPGLDGAPAPDAARVWADQAAARFADWVKRYGEGHTWDYSGESLDALAQTILTHCPAGVYLLDGGAEADFYDGSVWYFGEAMRRGKPSRWEYRASGDADGPLAGMSLWTRMTHDKEVSVGLVQELSHVVKSLAYPTVQPPVITPDWPRASYESWITGPARWRVDESLKRRERVKARRWRSLDDEQFLARWLAERQAASDDWLRRHGVSTLDALEALVWETGGPEALLEDPANAEFADGAIWYLGEEVLRHAADATGWGYERGCGSDPYVKFGERADVEPVRRLARVFTDVRRHGGTLRV